MTMQSHQISRPKTPRRSISTITAGLRSCTELSSMRPPEHIHRLGHHTKLPRPIRRSSAEDRPTQISEPAVHASAWQTSLLKNANHTMMRPRHSNLRILWLPQRDGERPSRFAPRRDDRLHPPDAPDVRTHLRFMVIILVHSYTHRRGDPGHTRGGRRIFPRDVERMAGEQEPPPPCISLHQPDEFRGQPTGHRRGVSHTHAYTQTLRSRRSTRPTSQLMHPLAYDVGAPSHCSRADKPSRAVGGITSFVPRCPDPSAVRSARSQGLAFSIHTPCYTIPGLLGAWLPNAVHLPAASAPARPCARGTA